MNILEADFRPLRQYAPAPHRQQLEESVHKNGGYTTRHLEAFRVILLAASCGAVIPDLIGNPALDPRFREDDRRTAASCGE